MTCNEGAASARVMRPSAYKPDRRSFGNRPYRQSSACFTIRATAPYCRSTPSGASSRAAGAQAVNFQSLRLRLEAQLLGALFQLADDVAVFQLHRAVAAVADQERHRVLRAA